MNETMNEFCSFELSIYRKILKNISKFLQKYNAAQFSIDNNKKCFLSTKSAYITVFTVFFNK